MDLLAAARSCFARDYAEARRLFCDAAGAAGATTRSFANPHRGPQGEELAADLAWFGPPHAANVLVLISATHGVEGFCGAGAQLDWIRNGSPQTLPRDTAALVIHAINPYGFAWLRRVTEEGVDLNRNFVDLAHPPPNPGYDELADAFVPPALEGPVFDAAVSRLKAYAERHGDLAWRIARAGGQYRHPGGIFYGGASPTWSRRTHETIIADYGLANRRAVGVIDYHTGLGPYGYGELICSHAPGSAAVTRARDWWGESVTEPARGNSAASPRAGLTVFGWEPLIGAHLTFVTLEYGTYPNPVIQVAMRDDHWLHKYSNVEWTSPQTQKIKQALRQAFYPDTEDWREAVLFRSRQVIRQTLVGLSGEPV
jgi:hypothetical protein